MRASYACGFWACICSAAFLALTVYILRIFFFSSLTSGMMSLLARAFDKPSPALAMLVIPLRSMMFAFPSWLPTRYFGLMSLVLACIGLSFLGLYVSASDKSQDVKFALIHATMYMLAAFFAYHRDRITTIPLGLDLLLGCGIFVHHQLRE